MTGLSVKMRRRVQRIARNIGPFTTTSQRYMPTCRLTVPEIPDFEQLSLADVVRLGGQLCVDCELAVPHDDTSTYFAKFDCNKELVTLIGVSVFGMNFQPGSKLIVIDFLASVDKNHSSTAAFEVLKTHLLKLYPFKGVLYTQAANTRSAQLFWKGALAHSRARLLAPPRLAQDPPVLAQVS